MEGGEVFIQLCGEVRISRLATVSKLRGRESTCISWTGVQRGGGAKGYKYKRVLESAKRSAAANHWQRTTGNTLTVHLGPEVETLSQLSSRPQSDGWSL
ncbi:hypothetical protein J6590_018599 [Homalodisca vitripennis]|nr:hypothetical protein J6590_018599 [Homalodisca vitripennis]